MSNIVDYPQRGYRRRALHDIPYATAGQHARVGASSIDASGSQVVVWSAVSREPQLSRKARPVDRWCDGAKCVVDVNGFPGGKGSRQILSETRQTNDGGTRKRALAAGTGAGAADGADLLEATASRWYERHASEDEDKDKETAGRWQRRMQASRCHEPEMQQHMASAWLR
ncbi:hypothetical protein CHU98_g11596 [Xylaria longipes]|nr:hypothetical protein CHU98_g11596 [Xylaria longipes]